VAGAERLVSSSPSLLPCLVLRLSTLELGGVTGSRIRRGSGDLVLTSLSSRVRQETSTASPTNRTSPPASSSPRAAKFSPTCPLPTPALPRNKTGTRRKA